MVVVVVVRVGDNRTRYWELFFAMKQIGRVSDGLVGDGDEGEVVIAANDMCAGIYSHPATGNSRNTHFTLEFAGEVHGTVEIDASGGVLGSNGMDIEEFVRSAGREDACWEQLRQKLECELESRNIRHPSGDGDLLMKRNVERSFADSSVAKWEPGDQDQEILLREEKPKDRIYWKLNEKKLRSRMGQRDGPVLVVVRVCFVLELNSALGNAEERIVRDGACFVAALGVRTAPGSSFTLHKMKMDRTTLYSRKYAQWWYQSSRLAIHRAVYRA